MNHAEVRAVPATAFDAPRTAPLPPHRMPHVLITALRKASSDGLPLQAAALAFITVVSLIPLLAAFTFLATQAFGGAQARIVEGLATMLVYSEASVLEQLETFLEQARTIRGPGFVIFLVTALSVFTSIERTIDRIWRATARRSVLRRLRSLTLILFWGPLLLGGAFSAVYVLGEHPIYRVIFDTGLVRLLLPFTATWLLLTLIYWQLPMTRVASRHAAFGGFTAALLIELLRRGFALYVDAVTGMSLIYGGFGLALLFMISIQLGWMAVLYGAEVTYCAQHARVLSRTPRIAARLDAPLIGLGALLVIADRLRAGAPLTAREALAEALQVEADALDRLLEPLRDAGLLVVTRAEDDTACYVLGGDPHALTARAVFAVYGAEERAVLAALPPSVGPVLEDLRVALDAQRDRLLGDHTLAALRADDPSGDAPSDDASPADQDPAGRDQGV
ncbi:MAG: YihY/virulence factor BrkB family protein [Acidobacteriota bacterium]